MGSLVGSGTWPRSSRREVRIRVPIFPVVFFSRRKPSPQKGERRIEKGTTGGTSFGGLIRKTQKLVGPELKSEHPLAKCIKE